MNENDRRSDRSLEKLQLFLIFMTVKLGLVRGLAAASCSGYLIVDAKRGLSVDYFSSDGVLRVISPHMGVLQTL